MVLTVERSIEYAITYVVASSPPMVDRLGRPSIDDAPILRWSSYRGYFSTARDVLLPAYAGGGETRRRWLPGD